MTIEVNRVVVFSIGIAGNIITYRAPSFNIETFFLEKIEYFIQFGSILLVNILLPYFSRKYGYTITNLCDVKSCISGCQPFTQRSEKS